MIFIWCVQLKCMALKMKAAEIRAPMVMITTTIMSVLVFMLFGSDFTEFKDVGEVRFLGLDETGVA